MGFSGGTVVYAGKTLPVRAISNIPYGRAFEAYQNDGFKCAE